MFLKQLESMPDDIKAKKITSLKRRLEMYYGALPSSVHSISSPFSVVVKCGDTVGIMFDGSLDPVHEHVCACVTCQAACKKAV